MILKIKILLKNYLQFVFQDFLYLTLLFSIIVFGLTADRLLSIDYHEKYSLLLIGMFFLSLFSTMNLYHNDKVYNHYLKQKVNSYWSEVISQFLTVLILNIISGILIFAFSLILSKDIFLDVVGIVALISVGFLGSSIAALFKTQWQNHSSLGQIGTLVFVYLALSGSVVGIFQNFEVIFPPLSRMIVSLQNNSSITKLLPIAGQTFLYALVLFVISCFIYKKNKKS